MNRRRDDLRSLLLGGGPAAPQSTPAPATPVEPSDAAGQAPRASSGAVRAMGLSLGQKAREAEETAKALEQLRAQLNAGGAVVELAPESIEPSFAADRLAAEGEGGQDPEFAAFVEEIRAHGQQVPILVRPHPENSARYQIAYGHRRWRAARRLGQAVKAQVRPLSDVELVVAQGQENAQRRDLSFIEKAFFARSLDERGFDRATLCAALAVQSAEISRLLAVARAVPAELVAAIGPAPKAGRPRWLQLVELLSQTGAAKRVASVQDSAAFRSATSDERFVLIFDALSAKPDPKTDPAAAQVLLPDEKGRALARREVKGRTIRLVFDEALAPDFAALVADRLPVLYAEWRAGAGASPATRQPSGTGVKPGRDKER